MKKLKQAKFFTHLPAVLVFLMIISTVVFGSNSCSAAEAVTHASIGINFDDIKAAIDMDHIDGHIQTFVSFGSRVTGYPGCDAAAQYIYDRFVEYGLSNVSFELFDIAVPYDYGANIAILSTGEVIKAYPLWPNNIETCAINPEGLEGPLIYAGHGDLSEYHAKVKDSIVLMDFDSREKWIYSAQFGAKAVIFIEEEVTRSNAEQKVLPEIPIDFPRLYVTKNDGQHLKDLLAQGHVNVCVKSLMIYQPMKGKNIVGYIHGTSPTLKNEVVVVTAYYDSASIVPSISPGAEEACGIASLLELARYYSTHPPLRTVLFVAFSGHNNGLTGARNFVKSHISEVGSELRLLANIDLTTRNDVLAVFYWGDFYGYTKPIGRFDMPRNVLFTQVLPQIGEGYKVYDAMSQEYLAVSPFVFERFEFDHEPFNLAGGLGFSFYTSQAYHLYQNTPFDTYEKLNFGNLKPQIEFILCGLVAFTNFTPSEGVALPQLSVTIAVTGTGGWVDLTGRVTEYNYSLAWYKPVPNSFVLISPINWAGLVYGARNSIVVIANEDGVWNFPGAPHKDSYMQEEGASCSYNIRAGLDDPTYGPIEYSTDLGKYGAAYAATFLKFDQAVEFQQLVVFKGGNLAIIGALDPARIETQNLQPLSFEVRTFGSDEIPDFLGVWGGVWYFAMVSGRSGESIEVIIRSIEPEPVGWLANASYTSPSDNERYGSGYKVECSENLVISTSDIAWDLYWLNDVRLENARKQGVESSSTQSLHETAYNHLQRATEALETDDYEAFYIESIEAWSLERAVYSEIKALFLDTEHSITFYFILLIPFALLFERLLIESKSTLKRVLSLTGVFLLFVFILYVVHPAFHLTQNIYMTLAGFVLVVLTAPAILLLLSGFSTKLKKIRTEQLGAHFAESGRGAVLFSSFIIGIQNMRRRKLRSVLCLTAVVLIVFCLISFTGMAAMVITMPQEEAGQTSYSGLFYRNPQGQLSIDETSVDFIEKFCGTGVIAKRAYIYASPATTGQIPLYSSDGKIFQIRGIIGLMASEENVTHLGLALVSGRWFSETDMYACIIPEGAATKLNIGVNDYLIWSGTELLVCGVYDSDIYQSITDLDQLPVTPLILGEAVSTTSLSSDSVMIVPYSLARSIGAATYNVAVKVDDPEETFELAEEIARIFPGFKLLSGVDGMIRKYYMGAIPTVTGWQMIVIPFVIASLTVLNLMLGAVYERVREIEIYASLGVSPGNVSIMFLAESLIYAVIGGVGGYMSGSVGNTILHMMMVLPPELLPNSSSSWVVMAVSLGMVASLLPTLYPAYMSSKIVTPSLERAWKMPTKPKGDLWQIPLPFVISEVEVDGIIAFLNEHLEAHRTERAGTFYVRDLKYSVREEKETVVKSLKIIVRLSPYEAGIEQETEFAFIGKKGAEKYSLLIGIKRIFGITNVWMASNRSFIDEMRKQLLLWRSLRDNEREKYLQAAKKLEEEAPKT